MALPKRPSGADVAAGTMGLSVSFWRDTESQRSRRPAVVPRRRSVRQGEVRTHNQIAFDAWDTLTDAQRAGWADVARRSRVTVIGGSFPMPPRLEFTRRMIYLLDAGRPSRRDPPGVEAMPDVRDMLIVRLGWDGHCQALWQPAVGPGSDGIVMFGMGRVLSRSGPSPPTGRLDVLGYADASTGHLDFNVLAQEARYVGWRPVSSYGKAHAAWRVSFLRGW